MGDVIGGIFGGGGDSSSQSSSQSTNVDVDVEVNPIIQNVVDTEPVKQALDNLMAAVSGAGTDIAKGQIVAAAIAAEAKKQEQTSLGAKLTAGAALGTIILAYVALRKAR